MHPKKIFEQIKLLCRKSEQVLSLSYLEESRGGGGWGVGKHLPPLPNRDWVKRIVKYEIDINVYNFEK